MDIDRKIRQIGDINQKIDFVLDLLEREGFTKNIDWETQITSRLTLEELIGVIVHTEQVLDNLQRETKKAMEMEAK